MFWFSLQTVVFQHLFDLLIVSSTQLLYRHSCRTNLSNASQLGCTFHNTRNSSKFQNATKNINIFLKLLSFLSLACTKCFVKTYQSVNDYVTGSSYGTGCTQAICIRDLGITSDQKLKLFTFADLSISLQSVKLSAGIFDTLNVIKISQTVYQFRIKRAAGSLRDVVKNDRNINTCLLYTSPSPRDRQKSRMPSSA